MKKIIIRDVEFTLPDNCDLANDYEYTHSDHLFFQTEDDAEIVRNQIINHFETSRWDHDLGIVFGFMQIFSYTQWPNDIKFEGF